MIKLTRTRKKILEFLAHSPDRHIVDNRLPDNDGRSTSKLSGRRLAEMKNDGFLEYVSIPKSSYFGYRITPSGRAALGGHHDACPCAVGLLKPAVAAK